MPDQDVPEQVIPTVSVLLALVFLMTGTMKLVGAWSDRFEVWGYPVWFFYLVGLTETAAGVALIPEADAPVRRAGGHRRHGGRALHAAPGR